jgi:hypothetical protein
MAMVVFGLAVFASVAVYGYRTLFNTKVSGPTPIIRADNSSTKMTPMSDTTPETGRLGDRSGEQRFRGGEKPVDVDLGRPGNDAGVQVPQDTAGRRPPSLPDIIPSTPTAVAPPADIKRVNTVAIGADSETLNRSPSRGAAVPGPSQAQSAQTQPLPSRQMTATLPQSLEVKPPGAGRTERSRRDRSQLGKSIENISCAASVDRWKDFDVLSGFVDSLDSLDRIRQMADAVPGTLLGDIAVVGARPCAIVKSLGKMLFASPAPVIDIGPSDVFHEGDVLKIEIQPPDNARYLEAFYLQADGTVRHLTADGGMLPPDRDTLVFGDGVNGRSKFTVGAPFGQEMLLALASNEPILGPDVPATQSSTELLTALSSAFSGDAAVAEADRSVTARVKFLSVRGR